MKRFEDSIAWQKAKDLNLYIHKSIINCQDYSFKDQLQRAAVSTMNNIAEGFERGSDKDFRKFLFISKRSAGEVRSMLILGRELGYINELDYKTTHSLAEEVSKLTATLIKKL